MIGPLDLPHPDRDSGTSGIVDTANESDLYFFDCLNQKVVIGDVCLGIGREMDGGRFDKLVPVLINRIRLPSNFGTKNNKRDIIIDYSYAGYSAVHNSVVFVEDKLHVSYFVKIQNPEFYLDVSDVQKIIAKQAQLKSDLKK